MRQVGLLVGDICCFSCCFSGAVESCFSPYLTEKALLKMAEAFYGRLVANARYFMIPNMFMSSSYTELSY